MNEFRHRRPHWWETTLGSVSGFAKVFAIGVSGSQSDWDCYGSGRGYDSNRCARRISRSLQESCALVLRNRCQHYGPIKRKAGRATPRRRRHVPRGAAIRRWDHGSIAMSGALKRATPSPRKWTLMARRARTRIETP